MDVLEVIYTGDDYDGAIERKLEQLGIGADQVKTIIAIDIDISIIIRLPMPNGQRIEVRNKSLLFAFYRPMK